MKRVYPFAATVFNGLDCEIARIYCDNKDQLKNSVLEILDTIEDGDRIEFKTDLEVD